MALTAKILLEEPPRLRELGCNVPEELEELVASMLAKDPANRPVDGSEVARRLAALPELDDRRPSLVPTANALGGGERRLLAVVMVRGAHGDGDEVRRIVEAHGGHFERIADGSMVVTLSGSGAATDLAAKAARCALALRGALWGGLVALATGRGLMASRLPLGEVIERAVRLVRAGMRADATLVSEKADTGERSSGTTRATNAVAVRLDETSAGLLDARFDVGGDSEGLALRAERTMVEAARTLLGKPTPCVGREAELGSLAALFAACVEEPKARAALVTAAAGVGKSRVRYEFMRQLRARQEPLELWMGRCDPMSAGAPFALLADVIRRATGLFEGEPLGVRVKKLRARLARTVPEEELGRIAAFIGEIVGAPFPDDDDLQLRAARHDPTLMGDQMRRAWEDWLTYECRAQPVVLVLEDLHWGDLPTVRFIDAALRNLRDQPLFILACARTDVHEQFPRLWAERDVSEIRLGELGRKASEKLAKQVLGADIDAAELARIVDRAAGNAFYLEELIRAAAEGKGAELPETVLAMVQARLERMEPAARHVLRAASLFGQVFWRGGLITLLGDSTEVTQLDGWLAHLVEREVISARSDRRFPDEKEYGFRHALVREAAYGMLTESDRTLGHRLAGQWLVRVGEGEATVLAEHFERGNLPEEAIAWYRRAAEQALGGNDFGAVLTATYRAVALGAGGDTLGALSAYSAEAHRWRGEFPDANECAHDALRRLPPATPLWFAAVEEAAVASGAQGQHERLVALFHTIAELPAHAVSGAEVRACAKLATQLMYAGRPDLTDQLLQRAVAASERVAVEDPAVTGRLYSSRALRANFDGNVGGFLELQRQAAVCAERAGDFRTACHDRGLIGYAALEAGALEEAASTMKEVMQRAERMGLGYVAAQQKQNLGLALARLGQLDAARAVEAEAVDAFRAFGNRRMESASKYYLGHILLLAGEPVRAEEQTRDALEQANVDPPLPTIRAEGLAVLAQILLAQGRAKEAHEAAAEAHATLERLGGIDGGEFLIRVEHAQALEAIGNHPGAVVVLRAARERLLTCANKIVDAALRESFLQRVPENARIMELAKAWL
jgi:tetratricopeptide (TPR) repeat protein